MDIEFKEKTFEKYFGHELARLTKITFSPDQSDEEILGFDEAFFIPGRRLFRIAPYVRARRRARMHGIDSRRFNHIGEDLARRLPDFCFNLFVQFKRPVYLKSRSAGQWPDWKQSYYRYTITPHQQKALERIEAQSCGRAAVVYASPAFWRANDLWAHVQNGAVVENSNMAGVGKLKGHGCYSYVSAGFAGKGHSKTVDIESDPLPRVIRTGLELNEPLPLNQHLKKAAAAIVEATSSSDTITPVFQQVRTALGIEEFDPNSLASAIDMIEAFSDAFGVRYTAMG